MPVDPTDVAGKRIGAWVIDAAIYLVLSNVLAWMLGLAPTVETHEFGADSAGQTQAAEFCDNWQEVNNGFCTHAEGTATVISDFMGSIWLFLILVVVFIVYQGLLGASLGKLAVGLRIVRPDGSLAGIGASAIRTLLWVVDAITCALPIVGGILILTTKGHRRIGDMAAQTYVVPSQYVGRPIILPGDPGWGTYQAAPPMTGPAPYGQGPFAPGPHAPGPSGPWAPTPSPTGGSTVEGGADTGSGTDYEADKPIWDDARNAYIQYDSGRAEWLEYDDAAKTWKPIST